MLLTPFLSLGEFLSTLSLRRATSAWFCTNVPISYFYPRSPCGERPISGYSPAAGRNFYPRSPCGERQLTFCSVISILNFYPRSPCGERPNIREGVTVLGVFLSTLSLRRATGGTTTSLIAFDDFYPRSPCGERRIRLNMWRSNNDFYPRSPCGERPTELLEIDTGADISIHALLAESDVTSAALLATGQVFLSTLSLRRATGSPLIMPTIPVNFYPRSPCGERPK